MKLSSAAKGILISAIGCAFFTMSDTGVKVLVTRYPAFESMGFCLFTSAFVVLLWARVSEGKNFRKAIRLHNKSVHLWRGVFQFISNGIIAFCFMHMSLAEFYVILFLAPICVALMGAGFLKEKLTPALVIAVLVSFGGVLIAVHPAHGFDIWALVAFVGTVANAATTLFLRKAAATETALSPAYSAGLFVGVLGLLITVFDFVMPTPADWGIIFLSGIFYALGQLFFVRAFRLAPASVASSPQFLQLVYGAITGYIVFHDVPSVWIYVGGAIVIGANLYLLYAQNRPIRA